MNTIRLPGVGGGQLILPQNPLVHERGFMRLCGMYNERSHGHVGNHSCGGEIYAILVDEARGQAVLVCEKCFYRMAFTVSGVCTYGKLNEQCEAKIREAEKTRAGFQEIIDQNAVLGNRYSHVKSMEVPLDFKSELDLQDPPEKEV